MTRYLLDVNLLLALIDSRHVDHHRTREWFGADGPQEWASCAITQNGFVRISSQPEYPNPVSPTMAIERLERATRTERHEYWPCATTITDPAAIDRNHLHGPRQVTDAYLLALAVARGGRFATFDRSVPLGAVTGAGQEHLVVI